MALTLGLGCEVESSEKLIIGLIRGVDRTFRKTVKDFKGLVLSAVTEGKIGEITAYSNLSGEIKIRDLEIVSSANNERSSAFKIPHEKS